MARAFQQRSRKRADTRPDFQYMVGRLDIAELDDLFDNVVVDEEVLPEGVFGVEAVALENLARG